MELLEAYSAIPSALMREAVLNVAVVGAVGVEKQPAALAAGVEFEIGEVPEPDYPPTLAVTRKPSPVSG